MNRHEHRHRHSRGLYRGTWHSHPHAHAPGRVQPEQPPVLSAARRPEDAAHEHRHRRR